MIRSVVFLSGTLIGLGFASGLLFALVAVIWAEDVEPRVQLIGVLYYGLVVLFPAILWVALYLSQDEADYTAAYASPFRAVWTALQGAVIGGILGAGPVFMLVAITVLVLFTGSDGGSLSLMLHNTLIGARLSLVAAAVTLCAVPLGFWAHYTRSDDTQL